MKSFAIDADPKNGGKCIDIEVVYVCALIFISTLCKVETDMHNMYVIFGVLVYLTAVSSLLNF